MSKQTTVKTVAIQNGWAIRGFTKSIQAALEAGGAVWNGKTIQWEYYRKTPGDSFPKSIKEAIESLSSLDTAIPTTTPKIAEISPSSASVDSQPEIHPLENKDADLVKQADQLTDREAKTETLPRAEHRLPAANLPQNILAEKSIELSNAEPARPVLQVGDVILHLGKEAVVREINNGRMNIGWGDIPLDDDYTEFLFRPSDEPDGTSPYMIENQRQLKPGQDWLGWDTCYYCGNVLTKADHPVVQTRLGNACVACFGTVELNSSTKVEPVKDTPKLTTITIKTKTGDSQVEAEIFGQFAIHPTITLNGLSSELWTVTHVVSQYGLIVNQPNRDNLLKSVEILKAFDFDTRWNDKAFCREAYEAVKGLFEEKAEEPVKAPEAAPQFVKDQIVMYDTGHYLGDVKQPLVQAKVLRTTAKRVEISYFSADHGHDIKSMVTPQKLTAVQP